MLEIEGDTSNEHIKVKSDYASDSQPKIEQQPQKNFFLTENINPNNDEDVMQSIDQKTYEDFGKFKM
jgi:hypothetical protein